MTDLKSIFLKYEEKLNLSAKQIAANLNISTALYSLVKSGKKPLSMDLADKLISYFNLNSEEIKEIYLLSFTSTKSIKLSSNSFMFDYIINLIKQDFNK